MTAAYIFGIVCGIAVLFLLKFMQVMSRELQGLRTLQEFSSTGEKYVPEEASERFSQRKSNLRSSGGLLSDLHGRPDRALSSSPRVDRRFGEGRAMLRDRAGGFDPRKPGL